MYMYIYRDGASFLEFQATESVHFSALIYMDEYLINLKTFFNFPPLYFIYW